MLNKQNYKIRTGTKKNLHNLFLGSSFNNSSSLSRNYKMQKQKIYKTRNVSLTNHNLSYLSQEQTKLYSTSKYSITNKHSLNNSILKRIKNNIRNKKIIDYSPHYYTELNNNKNYKNSPETISTENTSKRTNPKSNLTKIHLKGPFNFNKIKNKIFKKFNTLKDSLHLQKKITLEEEGYIITEESVFNNSNQNNKSKKNLKNVSQSSLDNLDLSFTYSDDTETKRYQQTKRKMLNNENKDNLVLLTNNQNLVNNNNTNITNVIYCGGSKNQYINNKYNYTNFKTEKSRNKNDKKENFKDFCEDIQRKLFGK
jgi:hypothetical protein